ncbi:hypothetical protein, partial [Ralstonia pseudosolanacearum]|uniref:hypothetical protein n=1 Tax=Ralstonia pseudosolanacearum TaxID=1310165 RepID=UPI001FF78961
MTSTEAFPVTIEELPPPAPFILTDLDVFNWGPFRESLHKSLADVLARVSSASEHVGHETSRP